MVSLCNLTVHFGFMFYDVYHKDKKFWEELISCFPCTLILLSDKTNREELHCVCMMKSIKQYSLRGCNVAITDAGIMKYTVEMASGGMTYVPNDQFKHSSDIKVITSTI
jgi:hypothetical protein